MRGLGEKSNDVHINGSGHETTMIGQRYSYMSAARLKFPRHLPASQPRSPVGLAHPAPNATPWATPSRDEPAPRADAVTMPPTPHFQPAPPPTSTAAEASDCPPGLSRDAPPPGSGRADGSAGDSCRPRARPSGRRGGPRRAWRRAGRSLGGGEGDCGSRGAVRASLVGAPKNKRRRGVSQWRTQPRRGGGDGTMEGGDSHTHAVA